MNPHIPTFVPMAAHAAAIAARDAEIARLREVAARREAEIAWMRRELAKLRNEGKRKEP